MATVEAIVPPIAINNRACSSACFFSCHFLCLVTLIRSANARPHPTIGHTYGFSPVWIRICRCKVDFSANFFPQRLPFDPGQKKGFSPVCRFICLFKLNLVVKDSSQSPKEQA